MIVTKKHKLYVRDHKGVLRNLYKTAPGTYLEVILAFIEGDSNKVYAVLNKDAKVRKDFKPVPVRIDEVYKDEFKRLLKEVHGADTYDFEKGKIVVSYSGSWQPLAELSLEAVKSGDVTLEKGSNFDRALPGLADSVKKQAELKTFDKLEAVALMMQGKKMTHEHFSDDEWAIMEGQKFVFEDGVRCTPELFWADRSGKGWETGWTIWKDPQPTKKQETLIAIVSKNVNTFNKWAQEKKLFLSNGCAYSEDSYLKYVPVHDMGDTTGKRFDYYEVIEDWDGAAELIGIVETRLKKD